MVLAYVIVLLIVIAILLRRDLTAIGRLPFRGGWMLGGLVVGLFFIQAVWVLFVPGQSAMQMALLTISQVGLVLLVLINHHLPGAKIFALGIILNILVMVANGGWMPLTPDMYHFVHPDRVVTVGERPLNSKNIILPRSDTRFWILSDIIPVSLPWRNTAVSLGDVLLAVGAAQFIFQASAKKASHPLNQPPVR
ncbi:MAG: hypothetical protein D6784_06715 [Chloroflexi bacterium]|nr:MAG: hypothetical protein D6784_06715 [Chloroflexota bacterium]